MRGVRGLRLATCFAALAAGCAAPSAGFRNAARSDVNAPVGARASRRTLDTFREIDLDGELAARPDAAFAALAARFRQEPHRDWCYALAESALMEARRRRGPDAAAWRLRAVQYSYAFVFAPAVLEPPNPVDPRTRLACELYNEALAGLIDQARAEGTFDPQGRFAVQVAGGRLDLPVERRGFPWRKDEFDELAPAEAPRRGELGRDIRQYGLGVPLVGVRRKPEQCEARDKYLIDRHPFAVTAVLRPDLSGLVAPGAARRAADCAPLDAVADAVHLHADGDGQSDAPAFGAPAMELLDPLNVPRLEGHGRTATVEAELSAPIVYALRRVPQFRPRAEGFFDPARAARSTGLVMLQPYQPGKVPVVFIHGLWSDPLTWKEMLNELGADPELRGRCQFWAFTYPTGANLLANAAKLRRDLADARAAVDPDGRDGALDRMALVGHSMGGLLAKLQSADSGDAAWRAVANEPFEQVAFRSADERRRARETFFFAPAPAVARVIAIAAPNRGSRYGNGPLGRLASALVHMPRAARELRTELLAANPGAFRPEYIERLPTSVDQLAVDNPILLAAYEAGARTPVPIHTVVGVGYDMGAEGPGDSIVAASSASLPYAASEIRVPASHHQAHRHPRAILEVKRILRLHLAESTEPRLGPVVPASGQGAPDLVIPAR